jgi:hypothetical protein
MHEHSTFERHVSGLRHLLHIEQMRVGAVLGVYVLRQYCISPQLGCLYGDLGSRHTRGTPLLTNALRDRYRKLAKAADHEFRARRWLICQ